MKKICLFIVSLFLIIQPLTALAYSDVPTNSPYYDGLNFLKAKGVITETDADFEPNRKITQKEFIKFSLDLFGQPKISQKDAKNPCADLSQDSEFKDYFSQAVEIGLLQPDSQNNCQPDKTVGKIFALEKIFFLTGVPTPKVFDARSLPRDIKPKSNLAALVDKGLKTGVISLEKNQAVMPFKKLSRGETANLLLKTDQYLEKTGNKTDSPIIISKEMTISPTPSNQNLELFTDVLKNLQDNYYFGDNEKLTEQELIYRAIQGMTKDLKDPFTVFQLPNNQSIQESLQGNFEGVGIRIFEDNKQISILNVIKNSPADRAGLQARDILLKVNDEDIKNLSIEDIANKIRGPAESVVRLTVFRSEKNQTLTFNMIRAAISINDVEGRIFQNDLAYITLNLFGDQSAKEFSNILKEVIQPQTKGLIIDLRNNPGGYLDSVANILGHFVPTGQPIFHTRDRAGKITTYNSTGPGELKDYPVVILVNKATASAAEIMSAALRDYHQATIIGTTTFGKGTVQELHIYNDGSVLKLTIFEWLSPNKNSLNHVGLKPDITIEITPQDLENGHDPQLEKAITTLREK